MAGITWGGEQRTTVSIIFLLYMFQTLCKSCKKCDWDPGKDKTSVQGINLEQYAGV
jgi:hypothetical protein